ncbi:ATP-dependent DNA helicase RecG [Piscinibacter sakaiensis]|uniref:ATP-dependent DNA helicase RecG n=1 Tax=Piscinibacter sakaiensis TaxID=1547922 RepID=A0A0K8P1C1_PISS1|nr:ATP-dependent DNA helicase RecG [Piscinibacter sakaiensis]GAP36462.1 ATP-dependent DNA helicase RecG [Piscinibacter sakaiensis]
MPPPAAPTPAPAPAPAPAAARAAAPKSAPQRAMEKLGLRRDIDLALHLPLRYEDETRLTPIGRLRDGETAQVEGEVTECQVQLRGRRQLVVRLDDGSGELVLRFLNFYPSQQKSLAVGQRVRARGEARGGFFGLEMVHPAARAVDAGTPLPSALTPVYPTSAALPQAYLRKAVAAGLARADLREVLPPQALPPGLPPLRDALQQLHHPPAGLPLQALEDRSSPAWQRLKVEELLAQQLSQAQARRERALQRAPRFVARRGGLVERLLAALPFDLTAAQRRVVDEIAADLARPAADAAGLAAVTGGAAGALDGAGRAPPGPDPGPADDAVPMHRLLQGDVGAGKTVVAALAAAVVIDHGWQCALMAPTEILAEQHFRKLVGWLEPLGIGVAWLTGSRKGKARREMVARVADGTAALVVGTHAVIQSDVHFARLGLAVIDEQHRFGVAQRLALRQKLAEAEAPGDGGGPPGPADAVAREPHLLMMSATPIPRTLAMTLYADLDISTLDELPPGRTPVLTKVFADTRRDEVVRIIAQETARGRQVYWVCPLIEESEHLDLQAATATFEALGVALPGTAIGLLHGRLPPAEKAAVMAAFAEGRLAVLVATTVIEVGVDVPNASLMVIEHAERFGLSQLHQLRGRVGRGAVASVCVLLYTGPLSDTGKSRLRAMAETTDGFEIARRDLEIRGPGEFLGARQSGAPLLRFADLAEDLPLVEHARRSADELLDRHPEAARRHLARWQGIRAEYLKA